MGGGDAKTALAGRIEEQAGGQADRLDKYAITGMNRIMEALEGRFGTSWGDIPGEVARGFDKVRTQTNEAYDVAGRGAEEATRYLARRSGAPISTGEVNDAVLQDALALDRGRRFSLGQIQLDEANAAMSANNGFMRLMTGAGQSALGLANTYQNQATQAAGSMTSSNPWASAMSGAASGAAAGSVIPGWGTAIGAVLGGVGGYLGGR